MRVRDFFKAYYKLSKMGIVFFAILTSSFSYMLSLPDFSFFALENFVWFCIAFYFVCSGSFILNQAQEGSLDEKMKRTFCRPIPQGQISLYQAYLLAGFFLFIGHVLLLLIQVQTALLSLITVVLYNLFYTLWWKKKLSYGAVLGAIPGAMPPVIGYSLSGGDIFSTQSMYLFLLLFFWQMPHFWSLAIHYKKDYKRAGFPILPVMRGNSQTLYQIGFYLLAYLGLALSSPLFLRAGLMYVFLLVPFALILFYQFYKYFYNPKNWLPFFLWVNMSILVYFCVPILDKWIFQSVVKYQLSLVGL
ncbi:MAG: protoheme IX farnesyltransferase [Bdellovibrionales bacterium]|nr:protoheme IX farnesyltransferase [Bdellovibrionales bacterium]